MVSCNYHGINFRVYFLVKLKKNIFVFMPIGEGKNKFQ